MLSVSIDTTEEKIDMSGITDKACTEIIGIPHSRALLRFADAFMGKDADELSVAREMLIQEMGSEVMVEVAGIACNFQRLTRIADSTGCPVDMVEGPGLRPLLEGLNEKLGINEYASEGQSL